MSRDPEAIRIFDPSQFVEDYDEKQPPSPGGLNDEIIAAADLNSEIYPRYYRRAMGFTVFGESCFDVCEPRDGYGCFIFFISLPPKAKRFEESIDIILIFKMSYILLILLKLIINFMNLHSIHLVQPIKLQ